MVKKQVVVFAALAALCVLPPVSARAADTLTIQSCLDIFGGLNSLSGYDDPKTGKTTQYKLGALRLQVGMTLAALKTVSDQVQRAKGDLVAEVVNGKPLVDNSPEMVALNHRYQEMLDKPCPITIPHIRLADLKVGDGPDENALPPSTIALLAPILDK